MRAYALSCKQDAKSNYNSLPVPHGELNPLLVDGSKVDVARVTFHSHPIFTPIWQRRP